MTPITKFYFNAPLLLLFAASHNFCVGSEVDPDAVEYASGSENEEEDHAASEVGAPADLPTSTDEESATGHRPRRRRHPYPVQTCEDPWGLVRQLPDRFREQNRVNQEFDHSLRVIAGSVDELKRQVSSCNNVNSDVKSLKIKTTKIDDANVLNDKHIASIEEQCDILRREIERVDQFSAASLNAQKDDILNQANMRFVAMRDDVREHMNAQFVAQQNALSGILHQVNGDLGLLKRVLGASSETKSLPDHFLRKNRLDTLIDDVTNLSGQVAIALNRIGNPLELNVHEIYHGFDDELIEPLNVVGLITRLAEHLLTIKNTFEERVHSLASEDMRPAMEALDEHSQQLVQNANNIQTLAAVLGSVTADDVTNLQNIEELVDSKVHEAVTNDETNEKILEKLRSLVGGEVNKHIETLLNKVTVCEAAVAPVMQLAQNVGATSATVSAHEARLSALDTNVAAISSGFATLQNNFNEVSVLSSTATSNVTDLTRRVSELETSVDQHKIDIPMIKQDIERLEGKQTTDLEALNELITNLSSSLSSLTSRVDSTDEDLSNKLNQKAAEFLAANGALETTVTQNKQSIDAQLLELQNFISTVQASDASQHNDLLSLITDVNNLKGTLADFNIESAQGEMTARIIGLETYVGSGGGGGGDAGPNLTSQVATINTQLETFNSSLTALTLESASTSTLAASLNLRLSQIEGADYGTRIAAIESANVASLIASLDVASLNTRVAALEGGQFDSKIAALNTALSTQISALEATSLANFSNAETNINRVDDKLDTLKEQIDEELDLLRNTLGGLSVEELSLLSTNVSTLQSGLSTLKSDTEAALADLGTRTQTLESNTYFAVAEQVTAYQQEVAGMIAAAIGNITNPDDSTAPDVLTRLNALESGQAECESARTTQETFNSDTSESLQTLDARITSEIAIVKALITGTPIPTEPTEPTDPGDTDPGQTNPGQTTPPTITDPDIQSAIAALQSEINALNTEYEAVQALLAEKVGVSESTTGETLAEKISQMETQLSQVADDVTGANERIDTIDGSVDTLNQGLAGEVSAREALATQVSNAQAMLTGMGVQYLTLQGTLANLNTKLEEVKALGVTDAVANLQTDMSTLKPKVATLEADVGGLDANVSTLSSNVGTLSTTVGGLNTKVDGLETDVGSLSSRVDDMEETVESCDTFMTTTQASVDELYTAIGGATALIGNIEGTLTLFGDRLDTLTAAVNAINTELHSIDSNYDYGDISVGKGS
ncbi:MAG: hypothetical protein LBR89_02315 [Holosporales bacterium]|jgi:chromosome segregation ATPase|nr:hypothetical protein [Holosporales bacterium]